MHYTLRCPDVAGGRRGPRRGSMLSPRVRSRIVAAEPTCEAFDLIGFERLGPDSTRATKAV
jgi:hypothetical protein